MIFRAANCQHCWRFVTEKQIIYGISIYYMRQYCCRLVRQHTWRAQPDLASGPFRRWEGALSSGKTILPVSQPFEIEACERDRLVGPPGAALVETADVHVRRDT